MAKKDNEIVEHKVGTEVSSAIDAKNNLQVSSFVDMSDFEAGSGFEGTDVESFAIPFIQVLQKMSPQVDEDESKYIQGAKAGMLLNTVTNKLYDGKKGVLVIPCAFKRSYIRWAGKEAKGGFKGELTVQEMDGMIQSGSVKELEGKYYIPNEDGTIDDKMSDLLADTRSHFVLIIDEDSGEISQAIISLSSTMIKSSRMLMTSLQNKKVKTPKGMLTPPTYLNLVRLTTVAQSNDKGTWSTTKFELEGLVTDQSIYELAKTFHNDVRKGMVNVDRSKDNPSDEDVVSSSEAEEF